MKEVYTTPRDVAGTTGQTMWQPRESDPGLEAEFLRRVMVRLGAQEEKAKQLAAGGGAPLQSRAELKKGGDGNELLKVYEPFDRAWRRVGLALDRVGFTVEDRERQQGQLPGGRGRRHAPAGRLRPQPARCRAQARSPEPDAV